MSVIMRCLQMGFILLAISTPRCFGNDEVKPNNSITKNFRKECLDRHNQYRKRHGAENLTLSDSLNIEAQLHAEKLAEADSDWIKATEEKFKTEEFGESVFVTSEVPNGFTAVDEWYGQEKKFNYDFQTAPDVYDVAGFTQVIWKGTTSMGVGKAVSASNTTFVVCVYNPAGNILGEFDKNVHRPLWLSGIE